MRVRQRRPGFVCGTTGLLRRATLGCLLAVLVPPVTAYLPGTPAAQGQEVQQKRASDSPQGLTGATTSNLEAQIGGGASGTDCAPTVAPRAVADTTLDSVFSHQQGPGW